MKDRKEIRWGMKRIHNGDIENELARAEDGNNFASFRNSEYLRNLRRKIESGGTKRSRKPRRKNKSVMKTKPKRATKRRF